MEKYKSPGKTHPYPLGDSFVQHMMNFGVGKDILELSLCEHFLLSSYFQ